MYYKIIKKGEYMINNFNSTEWKQIKIRELKAEVRDLIEAETKDNAKEIDEALNYLNKMILMLMVK